MMLSYNSVKCVTCHNSGFGKYFQVFSGWYLTVCILMVMFWLLHLLKRRDCSYRKQKDVEGIMGQDMTKGTLWLY